MVFCMCVPAKIHSFCFAILLYVSPAKTEWICFAVPAGEHWGMPKVINCLCRNLIHMLCSVVVIPWVALMPWLLNVAMRVYSWHCLSLLCVHTASGLLNESLFYVTAVGGLRQRARLQCTHFEVKLKNKNWLDKKQNRISREKVIWPMMVTYLGPQVCWPSIINTFKWTVKADEVHFTHFLAAQNQNLQCLLLFK